MGIAGNVGPGVLVEEADVLAPLPTFGGSFDYAFNDQWIFTSLLGLFAIEIDFGDYSDLSGEILQLNAGLVWKAFDTGPSVECPLPDAIREWHPVHPEIGIAEQALREESDTE